MATIYLVSCASRQRDKVCEAKELYTLSPLFCKMRCLAERCSGRWHILSSKYFLVRPDEMLHPYDRDLKKACIACRCAWAHRVAEQIEQECATEDTLVFLAGQVFLGELVPKLKDGKVPLLKGKGYQRIHIPLEGKRIGEQLQLLKKWNETGYCPQ